MKDDVLGKVLEVEKEIQKKLELEKNKCREWLEKIASETEAKVLQEEKELTESLQESVHTAKIAAEKQAAEVLREAHAKAETLGTLNDETLKRIILRHISKILPGELDDSQDVKD